MNALTFGSWLRRQQRRNDRVGVLARPVRIDPDWPRCDNLAGFLDYLERVGASTPCRRALEGAWYEWQALARPELPRPTQGLKDAIRSGFVIHTEEQPDVWASYARWCLRQGRALIAVHLNGSAPAELYLNAPDKLPEAIIARACAILRQAGVRHADPLQQAEHAVLYPEDAGECLAAIVPAAGVVAAAPAVADLLGIAGAVIAPGQQTRTSYPLPRNSFPPGSGG